jgi:hypothetical protein
MDGFYKNLSIMGGFLLLHITGAGQYSIDALCGIAAPLRFCVFSCKSQFIAKATPPDVFWRTDEMPYPNWSRR